MSNDGQSYKMKNSKGTETDGAKLVQVGQAAEKAGVSTQSLQYYLMVGLLEPTEITTTGRRLFGKQAIERIKLIKKLNESGYPLRAIRELFVEGTKQSKGND